MESTNYELHEDTKPSDDNEELIASSDNTDSPEHELSTSNMLESMISKLSGGKEDDPTNEASSVIGSMLNDNKQMMGSFFDSLKNITQSFNMDSFKNLECIAIRQSLNMTKMMVNAGGDEEYGDLRLSTDRLLDLLTTESYDTNKDLPEVLNEIKVYRKLFLQMYIDMLEKQIDAVKIEISDTGSQEFTVDELTELGKRIAVKK